MSESARSTSFDIAMAAHRQVNALFIPFLAEFGGWDKLPPGLDVMSNAWLEAEARIDRCVGLGDVFATKKACADYVARAERYLAKWRKILEGAQ